MKKTRLIFILSLLSMSFICAQSKGQTIDNIKEKVNQKKSQVKAKVDSLKSNRLSIAGQLKFSSAFNMMSEQSNSFDYDLSANLLIEYRGIKVPVNYRLTNGRSITQFSGPSFRTPSFKAFGMSPQFGGHTFHLGNRSMHFSKYTYNNLRFKGVGIETKQAKLYSKGFIGTLQTLSPSDQRYLSNYDLAYKRKAWGSLFGFSSEKVEIKIIAFRAADQWSSIQSIDTIDIKPKENTALSYYSRLNPLKNIFVEWEQAVSAMTKDASASRVNIETHQTVYNMLGLFEKRQSSSYYTANRLESGYETDNMKTSLEYEYVDKDYSTLGSVYNVNNIRDIKINHANSMFEDLILSASLGIRSLAHNSEDQEEDKNLIFNLNIGYKASEYLNLTGSYSNMKYVQNNYYRRPNSTQVDSLVISQSNSNYNAGAVYSTKSKNQTVISIFGSVQNAQSITNQSIDNSIINNKMLSLNISKVHSDKVTSNHSLNFSRNKSATLLSSTINYNSQAKLLLNQKTAISKIINYAFVKNDTRKFHRITLTQRADFTVFQSIKCFAKNQFELNTGDEKLKLENLRIECGVQYSFKPYNVIK